MKSEPTRQPDDEHTVGNEILKRLEGFNTKIQTLEGPENLPDVLTVRKLKLDLKPRMFAPTDVKSIREALRVSQGVFAEFLGVSTSTLQDWEQGVSQTSGPACRLMEEIFRDIEMWRRRIHELASANSE